jgi:hypothetical protein
MARQKQGDSASKKREKEVSTSFRQAFRIGVRPLFSTERLWGVGVWLRVHRQRAAGIADSAEIAVIARDRKGKTYRGGTETPENEKAGLTTKGHEGHKGRGAEGFAGLDRSTPGCLTPASEKRACRGPRFRRSLTMTV